LFGHAGIGRTELLACRSREETIERIILEAFSHFAAMIRRREHDDAAKVFDEMIGQILAQNNSTQRMSDEMDFNGGVGGLVF